MRLLSLILAFVVAFGFFTVPAFAASDENFNDRNSEGLPIVSEHPVLKQKEWNGKSSFKENTCYFVSREITMTGSRTLPESSMLVVENGGKLIVDDKAKLYVKGAIAIHSKGRLTNNGYIVLKSTSVCVINGKMMVNNSGSAAVYGDVQVSKTGIFAVKGSAAVYKNGRIFNFGMVRQMRPDAAMPEYIDHSPDDNPIYIAEEYSDYLDYDMTISYIYGVGLELVVDDLTEKRELIRSFESIVYKYDGDFAMGAPFGLNSIYSMRICDLDNCYWAYGQWVGDSIDYGVIRSWNGTLIFSNTWDEELSAATGAFYSSVLGKADESLFAKVNPDSPEYSAQMPSF